MHVPDRADLDEWVQRLDDEGIEHSGVLEAPYAWVVNLRDPDGIALELSCANMQFWASLVGSRLSPAG